MTIEIARHPYRQLEGAAFVSLTDATLVMVNDDWGLLFGTSMVLPGGCELDVDDAELERALEDIEQCDTDWDDAVELRTDLFHPQGGGLGLLVPMVVNDVDLPRVHVLVRLEDITRQFQRAAIGTGAHARQEGRHFSTCRHTAAEFGRHKCRSCMRRWWVVRAREKGLPCE